MLIISTDTFTVTSRLVWPNSGHRSPAKLTYEANRHKAGAEPSAPGAFPTHQSHLGLLGLESSCAGPGGRRTLASLRITWAAWGGVGGGGLPSPALAVCLSHTEWGPPEHMQQAAEAGPWPWSKPREQPTAIGEPSISLNCRPVGQLTPTVTLPQPSVTTTKHGLCVTRSGPGEDFKTDNAACAVWDRRPGEGFELAKGKAGVTSTLGVATVWRKNKAFLALEGWGLQAAFPA